MSLKATLTSKADFDALPEALRALYTEKAGTYTLKVEGMVLETEYDELNTRLAEFRDNNRKLHSDLKKFEGVDPEKYRSLETELSGLKAKGVGKADDLAAAIADAVQKATQPLTSKLETIERERDQVRSELQQKALDDRLWQVGVKAGVKENAKDEFLMAGRTLFKLENDDLVPYKGDKPLYSLRRGKAHETMTVDEWALEVLPTQKDFLYKTSGGTGARNDKGAGDNNSRVLANDPMVLGSNLEALAAGKMTVVGAGA